MDKTIHSRFPPNQPLAILSYTNKKDGRCIGKAVITCRKHLIEAMEVFEECVGFTYDMNTHTATIDTPGYPFNFHLRLLL